MRAFFLFICATGGFVAAADLLVLVKGTKYGVNLNDGQVRASIEVTGENNEVSLSMNVDMTGPDIKLDKTCNDISLPFGQHKSQSDRNKFAAVIPFMSNICLKTVRDQFAYAISENELLVYDATDNSFSFKLVLDLKLRLYEGDVLPVLSAEDDEEDEDDEDDKKEEDDKQPTLEERMRAYNSPVLPSDWLQKFPVSDLQTFTLSLLQTLMSRTGKQCVVKSDLAQTVLDLPYTPSQVQPQPQAQAPPQQGSTGPVEVLDSAMIAEKVAAILAMQAANDAPWQV